MKFLGVIAALMLLVGCDNHTDKTYAPTFKNTLEKQHNSFLIGILPQHNMQRIIELNAALIDQINKAIPEAKFEMEASPSFEEFERKIYRGHFDFAMLNPYQTVLSLKHGYRVFAKMGDDQMFRGIVLVRKDSGIKNLNDLKGRRIAYPAKTALAAGLMPQYYFHTHGVDVNREVENIYVGSQESSIMNVVQGHAAAGATWPPPWKRFNAEHPELAKQLEVRWETPALLNNGWVVRHDMDQKMVERFSHALTSLNNSEQGKKILAALLVSRFEPASNETYAPVRQFLKAFSTTVRAVEQ